MEKFKQPKPRADSEELPAGRTENFSGLKARLGHAIDRMLDSVSLKLAEKLVQSQKEKGTYDQDIESARAARDEILSRSPESMDQKEYEAFVTAAIDSIDYRQLKELLSEQFIRCGGSPERMNFIERSRVRIALESGRPDEKGKNPFERSGGAHDSGYMSYDVNNNNIGVSTSKRNRGHLSILNGPQVHYLENDYALTNAEPAIPKGEYDIDFPQNAFNTALIYRSLMHEEHHAISNTHGSNHEEVRVGYARGDFGRMFEEAVTDTAADETFLEYARSVGIPGVSSADAEALVQLGSYMGIDRMQAFAPYVREKFFLACAEEALSTALEVPTDVIHKAILRGHIRTIPLDPQAQEETKFEKELKELMNESFDSLPIASEIIEGMSAQTPDEIAEKAMRVFQYLPEASKQRITEKHFTLPENIRLKKAA